ncbi:BPSL0761 family protein [Cupriavidus phytorum]
MTTPTERAAAVLGTRDFLERLAHVGDDSISRNIALQAETLLRHYPSNSEMEVICLALPTCWQMPVRQKNA